jgi:proline iminopeptidase
MTRLEALDVGVAVLLRDAHRIQAMPGIIVQGRYDTVCPPGAAHALSEAWPAAELRIIPDAGHSATEPGICAALIEATQEARAWA